MIKLWRAARPYSYPAAIIPVLIGSIYAKLAIPKLPFRWLDFFLTLIGCIAAQAISNLANDLADFKFGIDRPDVPGRKSALVSGELTFSQMFKATVWIAVVAVLIGLYLTFRAGWPVAVVAAIGGILAIEYTAPPLKLKYRGLGDFSVFVAFGLAMSFGSYVVQASHWPGFWGGPLLLVLFLFSVPNALLVVAILHCNNYRDRAKDAAQGGKTVANALPAHLSLMYLQLLVIVPYLVIGVLTLLLKMWPLFLCFATYPIATKLVKKAENEDWNGIVALAARLDGAFGVLMAFAMIIQLLVNHPK